MPDKASRSIGQRLGVKSTIDPFQSRAVLKLLTTPPREPGVRDNVMFTLALTFRDAGIRRSIAKAFLRMWYERCFPPRPPKVCGKAIWAAYGSSGKKCERPSWKWVERLSGLPVEEEIRPFFVDLEPGALRYGLIWKQVRAEARDKRRPFVAGAGHDNSPGK